jgi:hypothetical protein
MGVPNADATLAKLSLAVICVPILPTGPTAISACPVLAATFLPAPDTVNVRVDAASQQTVAQKIGNISVFAYRFSTKIA